MDSDETSRPTTDDTFAFIQLNSDSINALKTLACETLRHPLHNINS